MACECDLQPLPPEYQKMVVENITIIRPPMLKIYYWEAFDIDGLNTKLRSNYKELEHTIVFPTRQINSQPLKSILWLRNISKNMLSVDVKRIRNCNCMPQQTRVGFNQFRHLYHCPHRRLIHINQERINIKAEELVALTIVTNFFLYGDNVLSFELSFSDERTLILNFVLVVSSFDPEKAILTKELIPINIRKFDRVTQPIWIRNVTMMHLTFVFTTHERNLKLLNPNLVVPRQSVWPLMVEYRPNDFNNELELTLNYEKIRSRNYIQARGVLVVEPEQSKMPLRDVECADFLYVVYPNRLNFDICLSEERTQIVNVHNFGKNCMEFRWQKYIINEFFSVTFEPQSFRLKCHHSKICVIKVEIFERILHFRRIPIVLEVHRMLDLATQIARAELDEIESIDDPKWAEDSYIEHVFLQLNIKADKSSYFDQDEDQDETCSNSDKKDIKAGGDGPNIDFILDLINDEEEEEEPVQKTPEEIKAETIKCLGNKLKLTANEVIELSMAIDQRVTIFEKLYWKYLSKSDFMRIFEDRSKRPQHITYEQLINPDFEKKPEPVCDIDRKTILDILSRLMVEAITELAKNWIFIPSQYYERLL